MLGSVNNYRKIYKATIERHIFNPHVQHKAASARYRRAISRRHSSYDRRDKRSIVTLAAGRLSGNHRRRPIKSGMPMTTVFSSVDGGRVSQGRSEEWVTDDEFGSDGSEFDDQEDENDFDRSETSSSSVYIPQFYTDRSHLRYESTHARPWIDTEYERKQTDPDYQSGQMNDSPLALQHVYKRQLLIPHSSTLPPLSANEPTRATTRFSFDNRSSTPDLRSPSIRSRYWSTIHLSQSSPSFGERNERYITSSSPLVSKRSKISHVPARPVVESDSEELGSTTNYYDSEREDEEEQMAIEFEQSKVRVEKIVKERSMYASREQELREHLMGLSFR